MNLQFNNFIPLKLVNAIIYSQSAQVELDNITMSSSDLTMILTIYTNKDISSSELAEKMGCTKSYVSQVVTRLEHQGYIYRKQLPERKRFFALYLTKKGYEMAQAFSEYVANNNAIVLNKTLEFCSKEEFETFIKVGDIIGQTMLDHMFNIYEK